MDKTAIRYWFYKDIYDQYQSYVLKMKQLPNIGHILQPPWGGKGCNPYIARQEVHRRSERRNRWRRRFPLRVTRRQTMQSRELGRAAACREFFCSTVACGGSATARNTWRPFSSCAARRYWRKGFPLWYFLARCTSSLRSGHCERLLLFMGAVLCMFIFNQNSDHIWS